jgi:hypothetical protein
MELDRWVGGPRARARLNPWREGYCVAGVWMGKMVLYLLLVI